MRGFRPVLGALTLGGLGVHALTMWDLNYNSNDDMEAGLRAEHWQPLELRQCRERQALAMQSGLRLEHWQALESRQLEEREALAMQLRLGGVNERRNPRNRFQGNPNVRHHHDHLDVHGHGHDHLDVGVPDLGDAGGTGADPDLGDMCCSLLGCLFDCCSGCCSLLASLIQ
jgi:hypothetical protein